VNVSRIFIERPVMTTLVMAAILLFGLMGYAKLPVSDLPNVDFPTIEVQATMPGASPDTMASSVATPLEKEFSTIAGLEAMTSSNYLGATRITMQFALDRNLDAAALDVQRAITSAMRNLPDDLDTLPSFRKVNPADSPIFYLAVTSPILPLSDVTEYAENLMAQRISMVSGVAQVNVYGSQKYAVRIQLDPDALASRDIGVDEVAAAVKNGNVLLPTGTVTGPQREYTVRTDNQLQNAAAYRPLVVAWRGGAPVRLGDLGQVLDSVENNKRQNLFNGTPSIILAIQRQPGSNTVRIVDAVKEILPELRAQIPASVEIQTLYDRSESIRASVEDVKITLYLAVGLVVLVIFLFLRNLRATIIPSLALPMSIVGTFAAMYLAGFSLDNISLMALTLSLGFVVDDAIVMLENVVRHMEAGQSPLAAVFDGSREISFTILSMTLSLAAVFLPVLFMGGVVGRLFNEFAVTIMVSILISGFVSLSLTPMLCRTMLKSAPKESTSAFHRFSEHFFETSRHLYEVTLRLTVRHRLAVFLGSLALLAGTAWLFARIPKGFLPSEDTGQIIISTEADEGISFPAMKVRQKLLADLVAKHPDVAATMSVVGSSGPNRTANTGRIMARLNPESERDKNVDQVIAELRPLLNQMAGIRAVPQNPPSIRIGSRSTRALYQFTLQHPDTRLLAEQAVTFEQQVKGIPGLLDVNSDLQLKNPQVNVAIDRDRASALGVTAFQFEDALDTAYSQRKVTTIYAPNNSYSVIMELAPQFQKDPRALSLLYVRAPATGKLVPLESLAAITPGVGPLSVNHSGQMPSATISFNLSPGVSLGQAVERIQELARNTLPAGIATSFQGTAQAFQESFKGMWLLLILSVTVIYIVLGILYESFVHPLTILSGLPSAGAGALLTLMAFGLQLDIYGFVGIIMLVGIVKKNAIMMIDFAIEARRNQHISPEEAICQGALVRFRPIMMTTMAALMGTLPIALGLGAGAQARRPLGLAVMGGLIVSQALTLYITPVYYIYLDKLQTWLGRAFKHAPAVESKA
jgi:HAE1 family hydrophobic/amphiphilic exporter-1